MLHGDVRSAHLRELLRFESERLGVPLRYKETPLYGGFESPPFRREALVLAHFDWCPEEFGIRLPDEDVRVRVPATLLRMGEPVGYHEPSGELVPLGAVLNNALIVFFSLEALAEPNAVLARRALGPDGAPPAGSVLSKVFDLVVAQALPMVKANIEGYDWRAERSRYASYRLKSVRERLERLRADVLVNEGAIEDKTYEIARLVRKNQDLRDTLAALEHQTLTQRKKAAEAELVALMQMAPDALREVTVEPERIVAFTHPLAISWDGAEHAIGSFAIEVAYETDRLLIRKLEGPTADGYPHPHISTAGVPCLGNIGAPVAKLLAEGQYAGALAVLLQYLRSYNPRDAYITLDRFDPDYDDERWDRCYENASARDCVDCEDSDCPHFADRHERCYDDRMQDEPAECIRCRECAFHADSERACRGSSDLPTCIACELPCAFAGEVADMTTCHENPPNDCRECDATNCRHHGASNDSNDNTDGDPNNDNDDHATDTEAVEEAA